MTADKESKCPYSCGPMDYVSDAKGKDGGFFFGNATRFAILVVCMLCLTFVISNSLAFNFTVICMTPSPAVANVTDVVGEPLGRYYMAGWVGWQMF